MRGLSGDVYLRVTVSNGVHQEVHYLQLTEDPELEAYHDGEWDYEDAIGDGMQLDYNGLPLMGDWEEMTFEVYDQHRDIAYDGAEVTDVVDAAMEPEPEQICTEPAPESLSD